MRPRLLLPAALVAAGCTIGWLTAAGWLGGLFAQDGKSPPTQAAGKQLPKPDPEFKGKIGESYKDSTPSYPAPVKAPPAIAFWSITMYDKEGFQVPNPIDRFAIGSHDKLTFNSDGSLDIYVQPESPGKDKESN